MEFTIHRTHRHVEGAGLHNEYYERDIPCDDYIEIEKDDEEVHKDIAKFVFRDYIRNGLIADKISPEVKEQLITRIKLLLDDADAWDKLTEDYHDDLCVKYESEVNNE